MATKRDSNMGFLPSIFETFLRDFDVDDTPSLFTSPEFNVYETDKEYVVEAAVPGLDKKDFRIEATDNVLEISCEKEEKEEKKDKKYYYRGFSYGSFKKSYSLPEDVDKDKIAANYENGILKVVIPKNKEAKVVKEIKIS